MNLPDGAGAALSLRVLAFMDRSLKSAAHEDFDALALEIHRWQRERDPVLAALTEAEPRCLAEIPAVPVGLFKDLPVGTVPPREAFVVFRTSGTTGGGRGEHRLRNSMLYDHGAFAWAQVCVPGAPADIVALLDDPTQTPDSSLAHMVNLFTKFGPHGTASWHAPGGRLDRDAANARLRTLGKPVFFATTAFALAEFLDGDTAHLPRGSVLMVTGGFKGRVHRLDGSQLYAAAQERFPHARLVTEYGMTELSSQLWGTPNQAYRPPPWLRPIAVEPGSGRPLPAETAGQLRFYDLCNVDSTLGVETLDQGVVHADGTVTLIGRLADAPARGCSLTVEEAWELRGGR